MQAVHQLLIISCDHSPNQAMLRQLALYDAFAAIHVGSADQAMKHLAKHGATAVLIDAEGLDGHPASLCRQLRMLESTRPLVVLGAGNDADVVAALDAGAIDYVAAPVRAHVLLARLRAHFRWREQSETAVIPMAGYLLHAREKLLVDVASGQEIPLTAREAELLRYLYRMRDRSVSQETLLSAVWGYGDGADTHTVQTHVYRLRRKIGAGARHPGLIVTDGRGYRLALEDQPRRRAA